MTACPSWQGRRFSNLFERPRGLGRSQRPENTDKPKERESVLSKAGKTVGAAVAQTDKPVEQEKKKNKRPWWLLVLLLLLIALTMLTAAVVVIRFGNFLPEGVDVIFLVEKKPGFEIDGNGKTWENKSQIELFSMSYENDAGEITVRSADGSHLFAPGTGSSYSFSLNNTGNVAVDYELDMDLSSSVESFMDYPVEMKMMRYDGAYVFGSDTEWVRIADIPDVSDAGTVGAGRCIGYTLMWKWDFESGNDAFDTALGNAAAKSGVALTLELATTATLSEDGKAGGGEPIIDRETGKPIDPAEIRYGGEFRYPTFPILLILLILVAVIFVIGWIRSRKRGKKERVRNGRKESK